MDCVEVELNMERAGELDPELDCLRLWPMASRAASLAMVDRTFSVAMRFSVWLVTCDWAWSSFRSREKKKFYRYHEYMYLVQCIKCNF